MMKTMKLNRLILPVLFLTVAVLLSACNGNKPENSFSLSQTDVTLMEGESTTLRLTSEDFEEGEYDVEWKSDSISVATVSSDGEIIARSQGTAKITATVSTEDDSATFSATVTVTASTAPLTGLSFGSAVYTLGQGQTLNLNSEVEYTPAHAANKNLTWTSSNPSIAMVNNGVVTPLSQGITTVTAKNADGTVSAVCTIRVSEMSVNATGISLEKTEYTLSVGSTLAINPIVKPSNATGCIFVWEVDDPTVATVSGGKVVGVSEGETTLRVWLSSNKALKATCKIIVQKASSVVIEATAVQLRPGYITITEKEDGTFYFYWEVTPINSTQNPKWSTNRPDILSIDEDTGHFTVLSASTEKTISVIVTCTVGNVSGTGVVNVEPRRPVLEIATDGDATVYDKAPHNTLELVAAIVGSNELADVTWKSSDSRIATVNEYGIVTAHKPGTVTITATSVEYPSVKATYKITVQKADYLSLTVGQTISLDLDPEQYPNDITWHASMHLSYDADANTVTGVEESSSEVPGKLMGFSASDGRSYTVIVYVLPEN
ncbi:MAG: Ig-like domain-containing protein [Clostridia bacterium]|nr:Ig-like domain-containing protein [Clostridia bacterium]